MPKSLRILMTCCEYPPLGGGASRVISGLASELAVMGHRVDVVTMGFGRLPRLEVIGGVNVHRVPCLRLRLGSCSPPELLTYLLGAWPTIRRLVRESRPHIVHSHFIFPDGVLAWLLRRRTAMPYLITPHGSDVPGYNPDRFRALHPILAPFWRRIVDKAHGIVSPSESLATLIRDEHQVRRLQVIPNGHHCSGLSTTRHMPGRLLVVSRLFERKGVQYVLEALEGLQRPLEVHIVGDGPHLTTLKQLAQGLDTRASVHFHGWLDNKSAGFRELLETSSIFAMPSEAENFPNALLEAMDAGLAIITTMGTGCQEVVGETAMLVPPRDTAAIRAAIDRLTSEPQLCDALGRAAHERVNGMFGWRTIAQQYVDTYEAAIRATPP